MDTSTTIFVVLLLSVLCFFVGVIHPQSFKWFLGPNVTRVRAGMVFLLTSIGLLYTLGAVTPDTEVKPEVTSEKITYKTVKEWDGGKSVVVDSKIANEETMKALGLQLKEEYKDNDGSVIVLVYSDEKAASQRDSFTKSTGDGGTIDLVDTFRIGLFSTVDEGANVQAPANWQTLVTAPYDKAFIGLYRRGELFGGKNQWIIQLGGVWDEKKVVVNY